MTMGGRGKRLFILLIVLLTVVTFFSVLFAIIALASKTTTGFIGFFGTVVGIVFFGFLPAVGLFVLVFYYFFFGLAKIKGEKEVVYVDITPPFDPNQKVITPRGNKEANPKNTLEYWLNQVAELQQRPRVTPKMVLTVSQKLEKFKNQAVYRDNIQVQKDIRTALNWCYQQIGSVEYCLDKVEKNINKKQAAANAAADDQPQSSDPVSPAPANPNW